MRKYKGVLFTLLVCSGLALLSAAPCGSFQLTRDGRPVSSIIIPAQPSQVEIYAASELQYHIKKSSGATLPIVREGATVPAGGRIYLGNCIASKKAGVDPSNLPGNGYLLKTVGKTLYVAGKDGEGDPIDMKPANGVRSFDVHAGTLFGVYEILENNLGVHWLWPGKLGEVIPSHRSITLPALNASIQPLLWFKEWRTGLDNQWAYGGDPNAFGSTAKYEKYAQDEMIWLRRQRFGRSVQPKYGHSFGDWWARFGSTHPEYFAMLPDGTRRLDPTTGSDPQYQHVSVAEMGVTMQKVADWKAQGMPEFINVCENDGWAGCACPECLAWDEPNPSDHMDFSTRLERAKKVFEGKQGTDPGLWMLELGSLSDRYARFWQRVSDEARKSRPDVKVVSYVYDNYAKPPIKAKLNPGVLCGMVPESAPDAGFPYKKAESDQFRKDWGGWAQTGCMLFLRPNYMLQGNDFPVFFARTLGEDLKFAMHNSMKGTDFDSLTGQFSTQGPTMYMLPKILNYPDASVESVLNEYYAAFGPAKGAIREYFAHWDSVNQSWTTDRAKELQESRKKYGASYNNFIASAPMIYTPEIMSKGRAILSKAWKLADGDPEATARVEWLAKGLKQVDLELAAERAYEHAVDTGDGSDLKKAYAELRDFRIENADQCISNFSGLAGIEEETWKKFLSSK